MRIKLTESIKDYEGKEILQDDRPLDIRTVFVTALNSTSIDDHGRQEVVTAEQKSKIYRLSTALYKDKEMDISLDDRAFIKERVGKIYTPMVYGRVCEILEGEDNNA